MPSRASSAAAPGRRRLANSGFQAPVAYAAAFGFAVSREHVGGGLNEVNFNRCLISMEAEHASCKAPQGLQLDQAVGPEDDGVRDIGHQEVFLRCCLFVPSQEICYLLYNPTHLGGCSGRQASNVTGAFFQAFVTDICADPICAGCATGASHHLVFRRAAFPSGDGGGLYPVGMVEGRHFGSRLEFVYDTIFAVLRDTDRRMEPNEPCWLIQSSLSDAYGEMVFDTAMQSICPAHGRRRSVEIPRALCVAVLARGSPAAMYVAGDSDTDFSHAVAPAQAESKAEIAEDYERRRRAFRPDNYSSPFLGTSDEYAALQARLFFGPRHPEGQASPSVNDYPSHARSPTRTAPPYTSLAPNVPSSSGSFGELPPLDRWAHLVGRSSGAARGQPRRRGVAGAVAEFSASAGSQAGSQDSTDVP
ncbi:hypothetical protein Emed_007624 [Eimeria media]